MTKTQGGRFTTGAIVEKVKHRKTGRESVVRLYKPSMTFWAVAGTESTSPYFEAKDGKEVRDWLEVQLGKSSAADRLQWLPVVEVSLDEVDSYRYGRRSRTEEQEAGFKVTIDRYFLAMTKDKREWRKLPWEACAPDSAAIVEENDRALQSDFFRKGPKHEDFQGGRHDRYDSGNKPFLLPYHRKGDPSILVYTTELWLGLLSAIAQIEAARKTVETMLGTKAGLELLATTGAAQMPLRITATATVEEVVDG